MTSLPAAAKILHWASSTAFSSNKSLGPINCVHDKHKNSSLGSICVYFLTYRPNCTFKNKILLAPQSATNPVVGSNSHAHKLDELLLLLLSLACPFKMELNLYEWPIYEKYINI